jgi:SAM-dependent methyltransferase
MWESHADLNSAIVSIDTFVGDPTNRERFIEHGMTLAHYDNRGSVDLKSVIEQLDGSVKTVLDCGCGVGRLMLGMHRIRQDLKITGYDFPNMTTLAEVFLGADYNKFHFVNPPLSNLSAQSFDLIVSSLVLQHLVHEVFDRMIAFFPSIMTRNARLVVVSRSYNDHGGDVWSRIQNVFDPVSPLDAQSGGENHQCVIFKVREP